MEHKTIAFLEIVTIVLVGISIIGIVTIHNKIGYGEEDINNATRYVDVNTIADALDRYKKLELGSERTISELLPSGDCVSSGVSVEVLSTIVVPKYLSILTTKGPQNDPYLASYNETTKLFTICAPEAQESKGIPTSISITR